MDDTRPDDAFDRELRRTLAAGGGRVPGPHVDAELAAAWVDRRLDAAAARSVETHLAECQDCQALFATLARTAPDDTSAGEGLTWWRRMRAGWLVPATVAAAAALVIWVAVPQQRATSPAPENLQARAESVPEPKAAPAPPVAQERDRDTSRGFATPASEPQQKATDLRQAAPPTVPAAPPAAAAAPQPPAAELERRDRLADAAAPPPPASLKESIVVQGETPSVDAQPSRRPAVAGAAPAPPAERQEAASNARGQLLRENAQLAAGLRGQALTIVAADGAARWRRAGDRIEFAPRAGAGFTPLTLPAPAEGILAGASPGGTVCWFVGNDGLVILSTDGVRFLRVTAPAATPLVAVTATDARTAIVTAFGGQRFRTADGGASWVPLDR